MASSLQLRITRITPREQFVMERCLPNVGTDERHSELFTCFLQNLTQTNNSRFICTDKGNTEHKEYAKWRAAAHNDNDLKTVEQQHADIGSATCAVHFVTINNATRTVNRICGGSTGGKCSNQVPPPL